MKEMWIAEFEALVADLMDQGMTEKQAQRRAEDLEVYGGVISERVADHYADLADNLRDTREDR